MIPKIIHHVWPGDDEFRPVFHEWRLSWMRHHPDWTFYFWRIDNLPKEFNPKALSIINNPLYSKTPKSDIIRFEIVRLFGGIYVDTDVECLKNFDCFLNHSFFTGWESDDSTRLELQKLGHRTSDPRICPTLFGSEKNHDILKDICNISVKNTEGLPPRKVNKRPDLITGVQPFTDYLKDRKDEGLKIYGREYFYPVGWWERHRLTENTPNAFSKHYWYGKEPDGWTNKAVM